MVNMNPLVWIQAFMIMGETSVHFKETPWHRIVEYTMIGYSSGYVLGTNFAALSKQFSGLVQGDILVIIPILIGLLFYTRFIRSVRYLNRWPLAIMMATTLGTAVSGESATIFNAITGTMKLATNAVTNPSNIVFAISTLTVLSYFIFTREQKGPLKYTVQVGRAFIMLAFGVAYSALVIGKGTAFVEMMRILLWKWLEIH
jgi:hypothetical protein